MATRGATRPTGRHAGGMVLVSAGQHQHRWHEIARTLAAPWRVLFGCATLGCIATKVEAG